MKIKFIGAIDDVTGSMTLLDTGHGKILIDCGLFQGTTDVQKKNKHELPFDPSEIKAILLTHAHLDHCGMIPRLVKLGFRGEIFCTKQTMKLARLIMNDSAQIMDGKPEHPLHGFYGTEDVLKTTSFFKIQKWNEPFDVLNHQVVFHPAGHILGASFVEITGDKKYIFSGDVGRVDDPLMLPPELCPPCDFVMIESTYGGKIRKGIMHDELVHFLKRVKEEKKIGIIASFAVARAQSMITQIHSHYKDHPEDKIRFVVDGPMLLEANKIYKEFATDCKTPELMSEALRSVEIIEHTREFESISKREGPLVVLSSSGMLTGGRIWRYLEEWQDREDTILFLPGYQGAGTAGRALANGQKKVHSDEGKLINWQGEVLTSGAFSSHADQNELLHWLKLVDKNTPVFINHGESESKEIFKEKLESLGHTYVSVAATNAKI